MSALIDTYGEPSASLLSGYSGCCRYISHQAGKSIDAGQVRRIHAQGKTIVLNFEDNQSNPKGGEGQGHTDATFAAGVARALGAPQGVAIYFSVDFEVHGGSLLTTVGDYFRGVLPVMRAAGYLVGAYGDKDLITALLNAKLIDLAWQTVAWSYGAVESRDRLLQDVFTQGYDRDEIKNPFYGGWTPTGAQPNPLEDPLADLTTAQLNQIAEAVWGAKIHNALTNTDVAAQVFLQSINTDAFLSYQAVLAQKGGGGQVDVTQLAQALAGDLGPDLAHQLAVALGAAITKGA